MRFPICLVLPLALSGQVNVLTGNYNNARTSANLRETILNTSTVNPQRFGKLGMFPVDGQIYAQPLYVAGVVFVATMNNSVYAFDGNAVKTATPLWQINLGPPVPASLVNLPEIKPNIGILSTPVIDLSRNALYVVAATLENSQLVYRLHALDLSDGRESLNGPIRIQAVVPGIGDANQNGNIQLDPAKLLQRPGLLLANNAVYVAFGSVHDRAPYHGWILAYDAANVQHQTAVFNVTPNGGNGGVWQSGRGLAADPEGNIYAAIGNGDYDGVLNFGESFVKLSPALSVMDWFAPADWEALSNVDLDLGSLGPILLPDANLLIGGDKASNMYLVNTRNMGHLGANGISFPQIFHALRGGGFFNVAVWNRSPEPVVFLVEPGDWTGAIRISGGRLETEPYSMTSVTSDFPWQGIAVSANGSDAGSGILWLTAGDHTQPGVPGTLYAFNASDLTQLLWSSDTNARRDKLGGFAKFVAPTVANGRVFVPTFSNELAVYGLLPAAVHAPR